MSTSLEAKCRALVRKWKSGQIWKDRHGFQHEVIRIRKDGIALIQMINPYVSVTHTQGPIPSDWQLLPKPKRRKARK